MIGALLTRLAANPWMPAALRYGVTALAIVLLLLALRRSGERTRRVAERLETAEKINDAQRKMLDAAARRPRDPDVRVGRDEDILGLEQRYRRYGAQRKVWQWTGG